MDGSRPPWAGAGSHAAPELVSAATIRAHSPPPPAGGSGPGAAWTLPRLSALWVLCLYQASWPAHATSSPENVEGEKQLRMLSSPAPVCGRGCLAPERPLPPTVGSVTGASVQGSPTTLVCTTWLVAVLVVLRMVVKSECVCTFCHRRSGREGSVTWEASEVNREGAAFGKAGVSRGVLS